MQAQPGSCGVLFGPRPESEAWAQSVPIADVHMHFNTGRQSAKQMLQRMKEIKVLLSSGEQGLQFLEHPIFMRSSRKPNHSSPPEKARCFGEIHINNCSTVSPNDPFGRSIALDSPVVRRRSEISDVYGGFVQIHDNKDQRTVDQVVTMAKR